MSKTARKNLEAAMGRLREAQEAARKAEREFLLLTDWEEQGTYDGITWWYKKGSVGCSYEQRNAVRFELHDQEKKK